MRIIRAIATIGLLIGPVSVLAYSPKEGNISATLDFLVHRTNFQTSATGAEAKYQGDLALVVDGDIHNHGSLELGVYHLNKQYFRAQNYQYVSEETELIEVTMGYREWISSWFSFGVAFSSAYSMGYVRLLHSDFTPTTKIDTSASDDAEYGFDFSLQADLYNNGRFTAVLTALYSLSVTAKPNEQADHYGAMIGLRYFIQEKQVVMVPKAP